MLESLSPWGSRSATPRTQGSNEGSAAPSPAPVQRQGGDHRVTHRHRISSKDYPEDCPPLNVRWFYATDIAKRKPIAHNKPSEAEKAKTPAEPKKYAPFSVRDSRSIELAFQRLAEGDGSTRSQEASQEIAEERGEGTVGEIGDRPNTSIRGAGPAPNSGEVKVPVNEDFLFDVDIDARELAPAYWLGPIYDVRRATWFYSDGSTARPCDENLATQLEEGYLKSKPWRYEPLPLARSSSQSRSRPSSWMFTDPKTKSSSPDKAGQRDSSNEAKGRTKAPNKLAPETAAAPDKFQLQTHRLFGAHMNSIATYQDSTVAWLLTDDFLSRMSSTVYQRFAGGGHLGGIKLVRGYVEPGKKDTRADTSGSSGQGEEGSRGRASVDHKRNQSAPAVVEPVGSPRDKAEGAELEALSKRANLERKISSIVDASAGGERDPQAQEEEVRQREEEEIRDDYNEADGDEQDREIEHLVLVTHGIGQRLGMKMESLNFVHDVNVFRKALKSIYDKSPDLQALNSEVDRLPKNCRIQVLPVIWRHLVDFPRQTFKDNKEKDLSDAGTFGDELGYPSLKDITVEGVPAIRNLIEDLFLDILLYQSDYREHIVRVVQQESNRIYRLFCQRNPTFQGKVSLVGHSLGSAICFDLLCRQREPTSQAASLRHKQSRSQRSSHAKQSAEIASEVPLEFEVEDFYCLGSPIGLFQMLKGKSITGRTPVSGAVASALDPFSTSSASSPLDLLDSASTSSPRCAQLYNIFHPTDPVAYRIEPLISPAMKDLKPQPLPYVKKGIFNSPVQGLSGIGTRVGQSVSGLWTSMTTGVASSLLNRSLGLQAGVGQIPGGAASETTRQPLAYSAANDSNATAARSRTASTATDPPATLEQQTPMEPLEHPPTLIDLDLETLFNGFQRRRTTKQLSSADLGGESPESVAAEERARQLRREEAKVRSLNANGRVDYSIQEGVFDISLIGSIASHLSYWSDEDINHFIISQLLARQRVVRR